MILEEVRAPINQGIIVGTPPPAGLCRGDEHEFLIEKVLDRQTGRGGGAIENRYVERALNKPLREGACEPRGCRNGNTGGV